MSNYEPALSFGIIFSNMVIREQGTGKLSFINTFHAFNIPKYPFKTPPFYITALVTNLKGKIVELNITARIELTSTGHVLTSVPGHMKFHPDSPPLSEHDIFEVPFPMKSFDVPKAGVYSVVVLLNNEELGRRPILFRKIKDKPDQENA